MSSFKSGLDQLNDINNTNIDYATSKINTENASALIWWVGLITIMYLIYKLYTYIMEGYTSINISVNWGKSNNVK